LFGESCTLLFVRFVRKQPTTARFVVKPCGP
jgi:hypothetical protein